MEVRIEKLIYGGAGLARTDQGVVFVERVLPGELVEVESVSRKKDYAKARLVRVLDGSDDRRAPVCPNFESVGCCDWAHITYDRQTDIKESILRESLRRLGQVEWPGPIRTIQGPETGYRLRAAFHVMDGQPGFVREGTHDVIPIESCAALVAPLNEFLTQARSALAAGKYSGADTIRAIASPTSGEVAAVFMRGREKAPWTHRIVLAQVGGLEFRLRPTGFFQPNRYMLEPLMERVVRNAGPGPLVLDLFCGDGFFTLPIARRVERVVGVDRRATNNAARNAQQNRITNIRFEKSSALSYLKNNRIRPNAVILDPPRSGGGKNLIRRVAALGATRIVYISCNPTTLAADARVLIQHGYRISSLELADQFPNTHHIESIALFEQ